MSQTTPNSNDKKLRVAIIGAGVAGCATAGALQDYGIDFVVYDKNSKAGGLWADNYPGASGAHVSCIHREQEEKVP